MLKKIIKCLLGIACLFLINIHVTLCATNNIPETKDTRQKNNNPLLNSSIKKNVKISLQFFGSPKNDSLSKGKLLQEFVPLQGIDGLVLNNTLSREGYDFYVMFTHYWTPPANAVNFQIIVKEYTRAGRNTVLAISLNDKELVYRVVTPSYSALDDLASAAANHLSTYLKNGNHLNGLEAKNNLKDTKSDSKRITSPFDVN